MKGNERHGGPALRGSICHCGCAIPLRCWQRREDIVETWQSGGAGGVGMQGLSGGDVTDAWPFCSTHRVPDCLLPGQQQHQHVHHGGNGCHGEAIPGHRAGPRFSIHLQAIGQSEVRLGEPLEATVITTEKRGRLPEARWLWYLGQGPSCLHGASRLRWHGLMGSIQSIWPLSLQCRFKCNTYRSVTPAVSLAVVHHSGPSCVVSMRNGIPIWIPLAFSSSDDAGCPRRSLNLRSCVKDDAHSVFVVGAQARAPVEASPTKIQC
ncbi:uncharacterized protein LOC125081792 [Lutra lutra]|uniref:uncharacterized protein LOC125081792 n=1 Tax=Lutra lutra TaxID=9657 RepID=UPI001FD4F83A|nr:uncharacterized protein LOC125081792 [Lutra lutra]